MSKLLSQGGFGCVFYPGVKCDGTSNPSKKIVTKIQQDNFNARNESKIGKILESIPNYKVYFLPVINSCPINVRKIDSSVISKCEIIKKETDYIAMDIDYINTVNFTSVLKKMPNKRLLLMLYQTYNYLLDALKLMQEKNVVHYDLKLDNLLFVKETNQPRVIDFGISIPMDLVNQENMREYFYVFAPEYYVWCMEINMINYLIHQNKGELTDREMRLVVDLSVHNNINLTEKPSELVEEYKIKAYKFYEQFVGKPTSEIIAKLKANYKTWDNYSLSMLMLSLISKLFDKDEDKNGYIRGLERLLYKNMNPNPAKRLSVEATKSKLDEVLYEEGTVESYLTLSNQLSKKSNISTKIRQEISRLNKSLQKAAANGS